MLLRYPIAVLGGYLAVTGLARLWVACVLIHAVAGKGPLVFLGLFLFVVFFIRH